MKNGSLLKLDKESKFQAAIARLNIHVETLRSLTDVDLQVFGGFMTLQIGLAAWLAEHAPKTAASKWGLLVLDFILTTLAIILLHNNYLRRGEVIVGLTNVKKALRFSERDVYLDGETLDSETETRSWWPWYLIGCIVAFLAITSILFLGGFQKAP